MINFALLGFAYSSNAAFMSAFFLFFPVASAVSDVKSSSCSSIAKGCDCCCALVMNEAVGGPTVVQTLNYSSDTSS